MQSGKVEQEEKLTRSEDSMWHPREEKEEDSKPAAIKEAPAWDESLGPGKQKERERVSCCNIRHQVFLSHLFQRLIRSMLPLYIQPGNLRSAWVLVDGDRLDRRAGTDGVQTRTACLVLSAL